MTSFLMLSFPGRLRNFAIRIVMVIMLRLLLLQPRHPVKVALPSVPMMMMVFVNLSMHHILLIFHFYRSSRIGAMLPRQTRLKLPLGPGTRP